MSGTDRPRPEDPSLPLQSDVSAFVSRYYVCHACGDAGLEARDTDPGPGTARFRLGAGRLLLSSCAACDTGPESRRRVAADLDGRVTRGLVAWTDPARLLVHVCSRPGCDRLWHHLGGPLPFPSLGDPHLSMPHRRRHPCPWCVDEDLAGVAAAHETLRRALTDLGAWEAELGRG